MAGKSVGRHGARIKLPLSDLLTLLLMDRHYAPRLPSSSVLRWWRRLRG